MPVNRVLFINMPFGGLDRPTIGVSLLKAGIAKQGIPSDIAYFNLKFAGVIGHRLYNVISNTGADVGTEYAIPLQYLAGDWLFSQYFYGPGSLEAEVYLEEVLKPNVSPVAIQHLLSVLPYIAPFLEDCIESVDWDTYSVVGFTSTFEQNMASLCLARMIKQRYPHIFITMGGANCEDVMGRELHRQYPFLDAVCTGEGDNVFPELLQALNTGRSLAGVQGLAWRDEAGRSHDNGPPAMVTDANLEALAFPDYDDYFQQLRVSSIASFVAPWVMMEGSRGCWWGAKSHCTFCGLNPGTMQSRRKSPERVLDELFTLVDRYGVRNVIFVDNIMDYEGLRSFVPQIAEANKDLRIFFEVKANMRKEQVALMAQAGITEIQPGIESFSTQILRLMGKGITSLQNVAFLKWCQQYSVQPQWNILYGFPKEEAEEFPKQLEIMKRITHLKPPMTIGRIRLDRFSPHYTRAASYGFKNVRPLRSYRHVYPFDTEVLSNICYFFDAELEDWQEPEEALSLARMRMEWAYRGAPDTLTYTKNEDGTGTINDSRFNRRLDRIILNPYQNAIYETCDQPRKFKSIMSSMKSRFPDRSFTEEKMSAFLNYLYDNYLVVREGDAYLAVALPKMADAETAHLTTQPEEGLHYMYESG